jgi:hypothetical protein
VDATFASIGEIIDNARPSQKITFAKMRDMGVRGVLIYCADYRCSHSCIGRTALSRFAVCWRSNAWIIPHN